MESRKAQSKQLPLSYGSWDTISSWSRHRDLNSRPLPYHGSALPLSYDGKYGCYRNKKITPCTTLRRLFGPREVESADSYENQA